LLLLQEVHPKVVQERLGHSRVGITLDIYSHVLPTMQRGAADKLDGLMDSVRAEAAAECREAELKDDNGAQQSVVPEPAEKDWLQLGYSSEETAFCATDAAVPNESDSQANPEWSHLDSNQGPPACEAGALTS
jgi:hypothetical protein